MNSLILPSPPAGGDQDSGPQFLSLVWVEGSLATVIVAMRFYARYVYAKRVAWDDWMMLVTLVGTLAVFSLMFGNFEKQLAEFSLDPLLHLLNDLDSLCYELRWPPLFLPDDRPANRNCKNELDLDAFRHRSNGHRQNLRCAIPASDIRAFTQR